MDGFEGDAQAMATIRRKDKRIAEINAQLAASDEPDPLAEFRGKPAAAVWKSLSVARKRAVVQAVIESVTILPAGRGRPAGWKPGQAYFDRALVPIVPRV